MLPTKYKKGKKWTTPGPALSGIVLNPERFASTPRKKGNSLRLCLTQSTASHAIGGTYGMHWRSPFQANGIRLWIWGWFCIYWFRIKGGNLYPIMTVLRTGKSSIILGLSKILKLASIDHPLRAIAINWLNAINIWLSMLANQHKLLALIFVLDFIMTIRVI